MPGSTFRLALGSLRANKLRSGLTLVGIVVGVAAVIAVVTIIKGLDKTVAQTFSSQGSTVFSVSQKPQVILSREDFIRYNRRKEMTHEDALAVAAAGTLCRRTGRLNREADEGRDRSRRRAAARHPLSCSHATTRGAGREWSEGEARARAKWRVGRTWSTPVGGIAPERASGRLRARAR